MKNTWMVFGFMVAVFAFVHFTQKMGTVETIRPGATNVVVNVEKKKPGESFVEIDEKILLEVCDDMRFMECWACHYPGSYDGLEEGWYPFAKNYCEVFDHPKTP